MGVGLKSESGDVAGGRISGRGFRDRYMGVHGRTLAVVTLTVAGVRLVTGRLVLVGAGIWLTRAGDTLGRASSTLTSVRLAGDWVGLVSSDSRPAQGQLELSRRGL